MYMHRTHQKEYNTITPSFDMRHNLYVQFQILCARPAKLLRDPQSQELYLLEILAITAIFALKLAHYVDVTL